MRRHPKEDIINLYAKTIEIYGRLDIAINNAGIVGDSKKIEDLTDDDWFGVVNANLNAMFYRIREEIKYMLKNENGRSDRQHGFCRGDPRHTGRSGVCRKQNTASLA